MYTIRGTGEYIHAYNLKSFSYQQLDQTIPINVANGGCLASSESPTPRLFVVGGRYYNGTAWHRRNIFQILDLSVGNWSMGPNMTQGRAGHGCVVVNDWLWVIGLAPAVESIHVPELGNSSNDIIWEIKGSLPTGVLFYIRLAVFEDLIFVVGGCTLYTCPVKTVIIIDTNTANMDSITLELPYSVLGMGIVVVDRTIHGFGGFGAGNRDEFSSPFDSWMLYEMLSNDGFPTSSRDYHTEMDIISVTDRLFLRQKRRLPIPHMNRLRSPPQRFSSRTCISLYWVW